MANFPPLIFKTGRINERAAGDSVILTSAEITGALTYTPVNTTDSRLSDSRTPLAHDIGGVLHTGTLTDALHGNRGGGALHANATGSVAGFQSAVDKAKQDLYPVISGLTIGHVLTATGAATIAFQAPAAGYASPLTTRGDLLTQNPSGTHIRLAIGTVGKFLRTDGTDPSWQLLVAGDIPVLDTSKITTGTMATARLGSGTADSTVFLRGDQTWAAPAGGSQTFQKEITFTAPSADGNAYPALIDFNPNRQSVPAFLKDVEGKWFGKVRVPQNYAANGKIILSIAANATSGVTRITVGTAAPADGESYDVAFTDETAIDTTVPGTAYLRKDITFPSSGSLATTIAPGDDLMVCATHNGNHANDTLNADTVMMNAVFQYTS